jgi:hypothetical protein
MTSVRSLFFTTIVVLVSLSSQSATAQTTSSRKVWSVKEIIASRQNLPAAKKPKYCQGGAFKPCVCPKDVPTSVQYRPAVAECGGKAAIVLSGGYKSVFSVVVRDKFNRDRWPAEGINGCSYYETNQLGLNKCSAFKVQKIIAVTDAGGDATVHCLGASGYSALFKRVVRMTAKISDVPASNADPLARWCLKGPTTPLN